jgi:hypothetical protein
MRPQKLIRLGIRAALLIILISSILYFSYYYTSYNSIVYLEYFFIFIAGALSFIIILRILNHVIKHKRNRSGLIATSAVLFLSVIIALVYFRYLTALLDTMRIKFVNESSYTLNNIKLTGCQKKQIGNIAPKRYKTVWIKVNRDCSINLSYNENGTYKTEVVSAFVTTSMGQQLTFKIGSNK